MKIISSILIGFLIICAVIWLANNFFPALFLGIGLLIMLTPIFIIISIIALPIILVTLILNKIIKNKKGRTLAFIIAIILMIFALKFLFSSKGEFQLEKTQNTEFYQTNTIAPDTITTSGQDFDTVIIKEK